MPTSATLPCPPALASRRLPSTKRHFAGAIATAAIVHAVVLFAVPHRNGPFIEPTQPPAKVKDQPKVVDLNVEPPPPESSDDTPMDVTKPTQGNPFPTDVTLTGVSDNGVKIVVEPQITRVDLPNPTVKEYGQVPWTTGETGTTGAPIDVASLDRAPEARSQIAPTFPPMLKRDYDQGTVTASFVVDRDGSVSRVRILKATHPEFAAAAEKALLRWKFRAGWKDNRPVSCRMEQTFVFKLQ